MIGHLFLVLRAVTMPVPLREPFFLRGRKSVPQRAVIMSCVLAALTAIAGWLLAFAIQATDHYGLAVQNLAVSAAWGVTSGLFLYGPINYWNRRSWLWTVGSIPPAIALLALWSIWSQPGPSHVPDTTRMTQGFFGVLAGSGFLLMRATRLHWFAFAISVAGGVIPAVAFVAVGHVNNSVIPGISYEAAGVIASAALFGGWFGALAIPWGLPFWWPPETEQPPAANGK